MLLLYLDDWSVLTRDGAVQYTAITLSHGAQLGLKAIYSKSCLTPRQQVVLLGMTLDSAYECCSVPNAYQDHTPPYPSYSDTQGDELWSLPPTPRDADCSLSSITILLSHTDVAGWSTFGPQAAQGSRGSV